MAGSLTYKAILLTALTVSANLTFALTVGAEPIPAPDTKPVVQATTPTKPKAKPVTDPFADRKIVINIPSRTLWLYQGNAIIKYFPVGVGRPGFMTPVGKYSIISKVIDPGWENPYMPNGKVRLSPGENNPLGTRWMGFYQKSGGEYGMHGTDNPGSVGKFSSHGCVRMKVRDAETLFDMVEMGTPVEVVYEPVIIRKQDNMIRVTVYADKFKRGMPTPEQVKSKILKQYPSAQLDMTTLRAALSVPIEQPVSVGAIPEEDILQVQLADPADKKPAIETKATQAPVVDPTDSVTQIPYGNQLDPGLNSMINALDLK